MRSHTTLTLLVPLLLVAAMLAVAGCTGTTQPNAQQTTLTVFTAASLTGAFTGLGEAYTAENPDVVVDFVFDGSQALRTQIEQGASADVFVSANTKHMGALQDGGFMENDTVAVFLENSLAVIVPADNPAKIMNLADLARPGVKLVLGTKDVPFGSYARQVLDTMAADPAYGTAYRDAVMKNVVSEETAITTVMPKLTLGEADAAFTFKSDVRADDRSQIRRIEIPAEYNVVAEYPIGILASSEQKDEAAAFIAFVRGPTGSAILESYGFDPVR
ncbi:molybdate ABC transporter substrate-binding protein [Methanoculleus sp. Wushi-C6]|uniref:Molybdate ABC transporter substrate-binding protein n=1 Tax=Methanoculleus caldifontis TaxID=2651577 RepID=A0ABU3X3Z9_9EURY|nr:molybdate ABC transporter substrate-binding protein [Methanoculleus sp. Wushi-C6]MDV2482754.1 molybdate ABC transporter substrate-binding protein [Methanoculleus sp. Wushi-C6]